MFPEPYSLSWDLPMNSTSFPTVPNATDLPVANLSCSEAEMLAGADVEYEMPACDGSCCDYPYTSSETIAIP